ncbi:MAG: gamma-glutamylcyclotransferase, partial [Planctomycetes bacterium]|nr:gamma-glutamylcyclotransferase [Planctomycetota bacterium]
DDLVRGELWHVAEEDLALTLKTLDEIECFDQGGVDMYVRKMISCQCDDGRKQNAYAYLYDDIDAIADKDFVPLDENGFCCWPAQSSLS